MSCPSCGLPWFACSCSNAMIQHEAEERDWYRDYGFNTDKRDEAERFIQEREEVGL